MSTRLVLYGPNGERITLRDRIVGMDLTEIVNADTRAPVLVVVEQECNMGHWHDVGHTSLPVYDTNHDRPQPP